MENPKKIMLVALAAAGVLLLVALVAVRAPPSPQAPATPPSTPPAVAACTTKDCFITLANDCNDTSLTLTEAAGVLKYSSSKDCVFTKTLVSLKANETQEMKSLLQGKSLACRYEKGKFDRRWANSLIFGIEYCEGELKDTIVELLPFL